MTQPTGQTRVCPTRIDDRPVLFAHKVNAAQCQDRQRGRYHKCYTCAHNNAWVASQVKPSRRAASKSETAEQRSTVVELGSHA